MWITKQAAEREEWHPSIMFVPFSEMKFWDVVITPAQCTLKSKIEQRNPYLSPEHDRDAHWTEGAGWSVDPFLLVWGCNCIKTLTLVSFVLFLLFFCVSFLIKHKHSHSKTARWKSEAPLWSLELILFLLSPSWRFGIGRDKRGAHLSVEKNSMFYSSVWSQWTLPWSLSQNKGSEGRFSRDFYTIGSLFGTRGIGPCWSVLASVFRP